MYLKQLCEYFVIYIEIQTINLIMSKTNYIHVRLTDKQKANLERKAKKEYRTISSVIQKYLEEL